MKNFFTDQNYFWPFKLFGLTHILCLLFVVVGCIVIYIYRDKIKNMQDKTKNRILKSLVLLMLLNMIVFNISYLYFGIFNLKNDLPFHLCIFSGYMFMIGILFKKEQLLKITFFLSFIGPLPAMIWPDMNGTFNSFRFYEYFISHHVYLLASLFSYYALNYKITLKDVRNVFIFTNIIFLITIPVNKIFDSNYIFSNFIPPHIVELYPFLKHVPSAVVLEIVGITLMFIIYQIARLRNKEIDKK